VNAENTISLEVVNPPTILSSFLGRLVLIFCSSQNSPINAFGFIGQGVWPYRFTDDPKVKFDKELLIIIY